MAAGVWHSQAGFIKQMMRILLKDGKKGWPVLEGKSIHQFNHNFARPEFTTSMSAGLQREKQKRAYGKKCREFYHSFRLAFRDVTGPTNTRTIIASIIPPQRFHTNSLCSVVLTHNGIFEHNNTYNKKIAHLCGILNSIVFDFAVRSKIQMHSSGHNDPITWPGKTASFCNVATPLPTLTVSSQICRSKFERY